jgi:hypothetical protein
MYKIIGANQVEYGPITTEQLRQWIAEGRVNAQTLAQAAGETGWKPISSFPEFAASFPAGAPPSVAPGAAPMSADGGQAAALAYVSGPAIGLIVTGALGIAMALLRILSSLTGMAIGTAQMDALKPLQQQNPQLVNYIMMLSGTAGVIVNIVALLYCVFIIVCAVKMKKLESYGLAMTGAILAMLPCNCPCCCIGIPIGIWALVMLNKPEVRMNFH